MPTLFSWLSERVAELVFIMTTVSVLALLVALTSHMLLRRRLEDLRRKLKRESEINDRRLKKLEEAEAKRPQIRDFPGAFDLEKARRYSTTEALDKTTPAAEAPQDRRAVGLLIASTRTWAGDTLSDERSPTLNYARTAVRIPEDHRIGQVERPWEIGVFGWTLYRQPERESKHFILKSLTRLDQAQFIGAVNGGGANEGIVFVHGFNNTVEDAVFRLAQIVWDTQFTGVPILFSWPSRGGVLNYLYDRESAVFSVDSLIELLALLERQTTLTTVHVVAHSMGNQIVTEALVRLGQTPPLHPLGELILAAPDVDRDVFIGRAPHFKSLSRGVTLYASSADKAMLLSKQLAQGPRAGDVPPEGPLVVPNVETIDVTAVGDELFGLNHDTFAAQRSLIDDIGRLILRGDRPPNLRSPQIRSMPLGIEPPRYWRYAD